MKFDKAKWIGKLTDEQKMLLGLEIDTLHDSWLAQLKDEVLTKDFLDLKRFLKAEHDQGKKIFPPAPDVYSWSAPNFLNPPNIPGTDGQVSGRVTRLSPTSRW